MYEWLDQWREQDGSIPRGGVTGWPLILFSSSKQGEFMAHAGAGYAEPYTAFPSVVATPNCMRPALQAGYRAAITSTSPLASLTLIHADQTEDYKAMAGGVQRCVELFEYMKEDRVVGRRILPPAEVNVQDMEQLTKWISENHYTAYHWAATCKSGLEGAVADSHFRVRTVASKGKPSPTAIIPNLRIGSAAALPELPEANPHLSITAFSIALADVISREQAAGLKIPYKKPIQLNKANEDLSHNNKNGGFVLRNSGQATPNLANVAKEYAAAWSKNH
jgi:choline dehydrogenase-like flavoprotein